jgi:transposase
MDRVVELIVVGHEQESSSGIILWLLANRRIGDEVMAQPLVPEELWEFVEPLFPKHEASPEGGRPRIDDRKTLTGILFVLKTGIPWEDLPQEMGCGSGMTCWRRLREWQESGVWDRLHEVLLAKLHAANKLDWSRAAIDSGSVRAVGAGEKTGPNPTDRSKPGSKHHVVTDAQGVPLQVESSSANSPDIKHLLPLIVTIPPVKGKPGRPKTKPDEAYADRAYDSKDARTLLQWLGIEPHLAKRGTEHGSGLGTYRWVVERTIGWLHKFRRLRTRFDRSSVIHDGFLACAKCLICFQILIE